MINPTTKIGKWLLTLELMYTYLRDAEPDFTHQSGETVRELMDWLRVSNGDKPFWGTIEQREGD